MIKEAVEVEEKVVINELFAQVSEKDWQQAEYNVSSGIHTLKWIYAEGGSTEEGQSWVDYVQWSGPSPEQDPANFQEISYKHDVYGRRSEKKVDGFP